MGRLEHSLNIEVEKKPLSWALHTFWSCRKRRVLNEAGWICSVTAEGKPWAELTPASERGIAWYGSNSFIRCCAVLFLLYYFFFFNKILLGHLICLSKSKSKQKMRFAFPGFLSRCSSWHFVRDPFKFEPKPCCCQSVVGWMLAIKTLNIELYVSNTMHQEKNCSKGAMEKCPVFKCISWHG